MTKPIRDAVRALLDCSHERSIDASDWQCYCRNCGNVGQWNDVDKRWTWYRPTLTQTLIDAVTLDYVDRMIAEGEKAEEEALDAGVMALAERETDDP
jgi:hypothetical protein